MNEKYKHYGYDSAEPCNAGSGRRLAEFLVSIVSRLEGVRTICDLGCGNGYLAGRLAAAGYKVTGIDASHSGIAIAKAHHHSWNLEFICTTIDNESTEKLGLKQFDLIISSDVVEHLYHPRDLMEVAHHLLRQDGHLIVGAPYHGYLKNLALSILNRWDAHHGVDWDGGHIKFFSVKTLSALVTYHGFGDLHFSFYGRVPFLWKNMICHARKGK